MLYQDWPPLSDTLKHAVTTFKAKQPQVTLTLVPVGYGDLPTKVKTAIAAVGTPQVLWIYKADPATGYAIGDSPAGSYTSCTYCEIYNWDTTLKDWVCGSGCDASTPPLPTSWAATGANSAQYACVTNPGDPAYTPTSGTNVPGTYGGPDSIGSDEISLLQDGDGLAGSFELVREFSETYVSLDPAPFQRTQFVII